MTPARSTPYKSTTGQATGQAPHRYFTEPAARLLIGRQVQARVAISRLAQGKMGFLVTMPGSQGVVRQIASGPNPPDYLVGVAWDDPRPAIPRREPYAIDWYTADEYRRLLGSAVEAAA
ncbi:MAG: hypothetical protein ACR2M4_00170 [Actinomycetota bacterium]